MFDEKNVSFDAAQSIVDVAAGVFALSESFVLFFSQR